MAQGTGTSTAVALSTVEAALLIVVGILATRTSEWWAWLGLPTVVGVLVVVRWFLAAPLRRAEALARLDLYFADRSELHGTLRDVAAHMARRSPWGFWQLRSAVEWWFQEDLVGEWYVEQGFKRDEREGARRGRKGRRRGKGEWKLRLRRAFWSTRRTVESGVVQSPELIDAVALVGYSDVARKLLARAKEEGFVVEQVVADQNVKDAPSSVRILHVWKSPASPAGPDT